MNMTHTMRRLAIAALTAFGLLTAMGSTAAAEAPASIPFQGFLVDAEGEPVSGPTELTVSLYDTDMGGTPLYAETQSVMIDEGYFTAYVGDVEPIDLTLFRDHGTLFIGVQVGEGEELAPRAMVGSVPYAAYAAHAGSVAFDSVTGLPDGIGDGDDDTTYAAGEGLSLDGTTFAADTAVLQRRIADACAAGEAVSAIAADGTVTCEAVGSGNITAITAGAGLTGGGTSGDLDLAADTSVLQARVMGTCPSGEAMQSIGDDGTVSCAPLGTGDVTAIDAGSGLTGGGTSGDLTLAADTSVLQARVSGSCPSGEAMTAVAADGSVGCAAYGNGDVTSVSVGSGLTGGGTAGDLSLAADTSVLQARVSDACPSGEAVRSIAADGSVTCESVSGGSVTAGAGMAVSGDEVRVRNGGLIPAMHAWAPPFDMPFFPTTPTSTCGSTSMGGDTFGSTSSTGGEFVGTMFFNQSDNDTGLRSDFTRGRLQVTCRGSGKIEIVSSCFDVVASVDCSGGARPWTGMSEEFEVPMGANWDLRVTASAGSLEWANPRVMLY